MKNIVLIGYRGVGKTEVSKRLSQILKIKLLSTDEEISKKEGTSIPEIVQQHGWERFRATEKEITKECSRLENAIIDTGGGIILDEDNVRNLRKKGVLFLLTADARTIKKRIKDWNNRPPLTDSQSTISEIETVLKQREEKYNKAADYVIETGNLSVEEVANEILRILKK